MGDPSTREAAPPSPPADPRRPTDGSASRANGRRRRSAGERGPLEDAPDAVAVAALYRRLDALGDAAREELKAALEASDRLPPAAHGRSRAMRLEREGS